MASDARTQWRYAVFEQCKTKTKPANAPAHSTNLNAWAARSYTVGASGTPWRVSNPDKTIPISSRGVATAGAHASMPSLATHQPRTHQMPVKSVHTCESGDAFFVVHLTCLNQPRFLRLSKPNHPNFMG